MSHSAKILWGEGLFLRPQHFQRQDAYHEARLAEMSRALHPDRYAGRPSSERREALSRAMSVNEAFRKLRDPLSRAEALLSQLGRDVSETNLPKPDAALLMRVMEQREELSAARRAGDRARIETLLSRASVESEDATERLADAFAEEPIPIDEVLKLLGELRYLQRLKQEAGAALDEL